MVVSWSTGCRSLAAITAAVDLFLDPYGYRELTSKHSIRTLVERLQNVVQASEKTILAHFGAAVTNVALAAHMLHCEFAAANGDRVKTACDVYPLDERLAWAPQAGCEGEIGLAECWRLWHPATRCWARITFPPFWNDGRSYR